MTKRTAHHGGSPAPYTKQRKTRYRYEQTPLHNSMEGVKVTRKNLIAFYTRLGNRLALKKLNAEAEKV